MTREALLKELPPYVGASVVITDEQTVHDIVFEILDAHKEFSKYYDSIALYFDGNNVDEVADQLANFCKRNLYYKEETEDDQTTMLPSGILTRGGDKSIGIDCKHYASFCGGILDALNRNGNKIDWCYRFASYKLMNKTPHHVFVVVNPGKDEIWIDPTPKSDVLVPYWHVDKKIKADKMLRRVITGTELGEMVQERNLGTIYSLKPVVNVDMINYDGKGRYAGVFNPMLQLSEYSEYGGNAVVNWDNVANAINQEIAKGPEPGHTVDGQFVKFVYDWNIRSWNFYYNGGVKPGFTAQNLLPATWPRLVISDDGTRLSLSPNVKVDDYRNAEIHLLTAWAQDLINTYDGSPYPIKPSQVKEFSQGNFDGNFFNEPRGTSFLKAVANTFKDVVSFVAKGVVKIVGSIPRNAFLGLVGINAFNFARNLQDNIDAGKWDDIASKWRKLGGNPDRLYNTIQDGKDKNAILGNADSDNTIGEFSVSALLAAAAPVIALLLKFLDKDGKATEVLSATKNFLQTNYPDIDLDAFGFLDKTTGQHLEIQIDPADDENYGGGNNDMPGDTGILSTLKKNPLPAAGIAAVAAHFIFNKPGRKPNYILPLAIGGGVYFLLSTVMGGGITVDKRKWVINYINAQGSEAASVLPKIQSMSYNEIEIVYEWLSNYISKNIPVPTDGLLYQQMMVLNNKYQLFGS